MSNSVYACSSYRVTEVAMKNVCPETYPALEKVCDEVGDDIVQRLASSDTRFDSDDEEQAYERLEDAWNNFATEFEKKAKITVFFEYHDQEARGEREDDVNGWFIVGDFKCLYKPSRALSKLMKACEDPIELVRYVHNG